MENEKGIVKLTRKQLYDEIWALSVAGVARKYNLNYGKLIATCKVENISFPSSGYWTKKNMGKDVSNEIVEFSGLEDTEISLITKDAVVKRIRKAKAEVVEKVHTDVTEELDVVTEEDLPQKKTDNIQKKYLHTIGNLTLTAYNSEMSDRPFLEKMDMPGGFKESALRLNKYVVLQNKWNEKHIQERANELAKKAESIWPYPTLTVAELAPYQVEEKTVQKYSLETYDVNAFTRILFESLDKRIMNLSPAVKKEYKKLYVAYKLDTNFVDIVFQKQRLRISINMKFSEINDPNGICKDITGLGRWGNGDVELFMEHQDELDQIMEIVKQSFDAQAE